MIPARKAILETHGAMCLVGQYGYFLEVNKNWEDLTGYSRDELIKMTWREITHKEDIATDQMFVDALLARDLPTYQMIKRYIKKNGDTIRVLLTVLPVFELGHFKYFISQALELKEL